jgi:hypothetical protein
MTPRELDSVIVACPACGRAVELFTDEPKRQCRCGHVLLREALPQCAKWCAAAERCLGIAVDAREVERRTKEIDEAKIDLEALKKRAAAREEPDEPET